MPRWIKGIQTHYMGAFTVANLPTVGVVPGDTAYATNGRAAAQGAGAGTGVQVFRNNTPAWIAVDSGAVVTA